MFDMDSDPYNNEIQAKWEGLGVASLQFDAASFSFLRLPTATTKLPRSCCNACNDDSFDRPQQDLGDWEGLEACRASASSSFLKLPAAPYTNHAATTRLSQCVQR